MKLHYDLFKVVGTECGRPSHTSQRLMYRVHDYMPYYVDFREGVKSEYLEKNPRSTGDINCGNFFLFRRKLMRVYKKDRA